MVVAGNAVSQGGKALVNALDHYFIGQAVPQVLYLWEWEKPQSVRPPDRGLSVKEEPYTTNDACPVFTINQSPVPTISQLTC
jgi:hypothetical protein